jgi:hypothetical protein
MADDQIELHLDEFAREIANALGVARAPAVLDPDVARRCSSRVPATLR